MAAVRASTPFDADGVPALCAAVTRNNAWRLVGLRTVRPINSSKQARFAVGRNRRSGPVVVSNIVMALVSLEKPTSPERIPVDGNDAPALRLNLILDPSFIEEVHRDADCQGHDARQQNCRAHG